MPERTTYIIGVTGNIACGKSLVTSILKELGATTIDADRVAHELMNPGTDVFNAIADRFGADVVAEDGTLDRKTLGAIVFADPDALADLERITHPSIVAEILRRARQADTPVTVIDAIKLFEAGLADHCDETWTVYCDPDVQISRLMQRNGLSREEAQRRIDAQPPQEEKLTRADRTIDNSGTVEETRRQVIAAWPVTQHAPD